MWKKMLKKWIQQNIKLVIGSATVGAISVAMSGCAGTPLTVAPTTATASTQSAVAATTSATTKSTATTTVPGQATATQKTEFLAWAETCQSFNVMKYGALTAIEANKIPTSKFPMIRESIVTLTPLCNSYPTNPEQAIAQLETGMANLALEIGKQNLQTPSTLPIPSATTTLGASK
jgi:hypothetical protein